MSDYLVNLGKNPTARQVIKKIGLPLPLPQDLKRSDSPLEDRPVEDMPVVVCHMKKSVLAPVLAKILAKAGTDIFIYGETDNLKTYEEQGEAFGRLPGTDIPGDLRAHGLLLDATGIENPGQLGVLYDFFHNWIGKMRKCGRIIILSRDPDTVKKPEQAAAVRALEGFIRSVAREIGRRGSTAQLLIVDKGAEDRLEPVLRFFLSVRSAYISGQRIHVSSIVKSSDEISYVRPLDGKIALVTGAARGIGAVIARVMAREGAHVICMDRPSEETPTSIMAQEVGGTMLLCDITDQDSGDTVSEFIKERFKKIDLIVHNAGVTRDKTLAKMDTEKWDMTLDVNLISLMRLNEALIPLMQKNGRIVCVSSVAGIAGNTGQSNYAASKAGIIGYIRAKAPALKDRGIAINAVAPGLIETKMTAAMPAPVREAGRRLTNLLQGGWPEDVAETVTFLCSPGAHALTGEVIRICGGSYLGA